MQLGYPIPLALQTRAHQEAIKEYRSGRQRELWQLEHDADLHNEINPFTAQVSLLGDAHAVLDAGRIGQLGIGEQPLRFSLFKHAIWALGPLTRCWVRGGEVRSCRRRRHCRRCDRSVVEGIGRFGCHTLRRRTMGTSREWCIGEIVWTEMD